MGDKEEHHVGFAMDIFDPQHYAAKVGLEYSNI